MVCIINDTNGEMLLYMIAYNYLLLAHNSNIQSMFLDWYTN